LRILEEGLLFLMWEIDFSGFPVDSSYFRS
jgi:hypothetical protein